MFGGSFLHRCSGSAVPLLASLLLAAACSSSSPGPAGFEDAASTDGAETSGAENGGLVLSVSPVRSTGAVEEGSDGVTADDGSEGQPGAPVVLVDRETGEVTPFAGAAGYESAGGATLPLDGTRYATATATDDDGRRFVDILRIDTDARTFAAIGRLRPGLGVVGAGGGDLWVSETEGSDDYFQNLFYRYDLATGELDEEAVFTTDTNGPSDPCEMTGAVTIGADGSAMTRIRTGWARIAPGADAPECSGPGTFGDVLDRANLAALITLRNGDSPSEALLDALLASDVPVASNGVLHDGWLWWTIGSGLSEILAAEALALEADGYIEGLVRFDPEQMAPVEVLPYRLDEGEARDPGGSLGRTIGVSGGHIVAIGGSSDPEIIDPTSGAITPFQPQWPTPDLPPAIFATRGDPAAVWVQVRQPGGFPPRSEITYQRIDPVSGEVLLVVTGADLVDS